MLFIILFLLLDEGLFKLWDATAIKLISETI